ncbi:MAG: hypothetical protein ACRDHK_10300, partial [Actinomycetota bacterium]
GNTTTYAHDNQDRRTLGTADDGTTYQFTYDPVGNLATQIDPRGVFKTLVYDPVQRLVALFFGPVPGVEGTTEQRFEYDGRSLLTMAYDNNDPSDGVDDVIVAFARDSLGRTMEQGQAFSDGTPAQYLDQGWQAEDLLVALTYPSGREILRAHDAAERVISINDTQTSEGVDFRYFGRGRIHTETRTNGVRSTRLDDAGTADIGFDGAGQTVLLRHLGPANTLLAGFEHTYDRAGNRTSERRLHVPGIPGTFEGRTHAFDSANRLVQGLEGFLDAAHSLTGAPTDSWTWVLDGPGNWARHTRNGVLRMNEVNRLNQYDDEPLDGGARVDDGIPDDFADDASTPAADGLDDSYDTAGNETNTGLFRIVFDALGRPVKAFRNADGLQVGAYKYDAFGGMAERVVTNSGPWDDARRYWSFEARKGPWDNGPWSTTPHGPERTFSHLDYLIRSLGRTPTLMLDATAAGETSLQGAVFREVIYFSPAKPLWQVQGDGSAQYFLRDAPGSTIAMAPATTSQ